MAAKEGKGLGKGCFNDLPTELANSIWGLLDGDGEARRMLMQSSPSVRMLFSPSVQSLRVSLASPSSSLLCGLHKDVRVRKLTLVDAADRADRTEEQKEQLYAALSLVSKSQQFRRVVDLTLEDMHLDPETALHLSPLLYVIEALHLHGCQVDKRSLAMLGNCKHLKQLSLVNIELAAGAAESLHVLAAEDCPGLELTVDNVQGSQPSSVLAALAPCVTHVNVRTRTTQELAAVLTTVVQKQYIFLQHLHLSTPEVTPVSLSLVDMQRLASACPQLHLFFCHRIVLPDLQCLRALLEMPHVQQLHINCVRSIGEPGGSIKWPACKQPAGIRVESIPLSVMPSLPLEHCSDVYIHRLYIPPGLTQQQLTEGMRAALLRAEKCPKVLVFSIRGGGEQPEAGAGLSALTAGCPLHLHMGQQVLSNLALEPEDIQGVAAAWGTSLRYLALNRCTLSASAWATLASSSFPALETLDLHRIKDVQQLAQHLVAFFLAWPSTHQLSVQVPGYVATQCLTTWSDILRAHQRHNIQLVAGA